MPDVTTERRSPLWARLKAILTGGAFFVPGFLFSLPLTVQWAKRQCPGEPLCVLIAIFPSFLIGILVAIGCSVYFLLETNLRIRESNWSEGERSQRHKLP
jgi:hypothetical protein